MIVKVNRTLTKEEKLKLEIHIAGKLMDEAKKKRSKLAQDKLHDYIVNGLKIIVEDTNGKS